ncbi:MAG: DNA mismatch endonuclease Vsr [Pseudomonadota bacterium]|nr:DNA mismatch endonuclease Vsr [Pseudomonadota bacterium]
MVDIVDKSTRSKMMSGIKGKDTKPEIIIRKALFKMGFRYRIHNTRLPGRPDIVLPKYHAVILVNGCFWHGHNCHLFKWPSTRPDFWKEKICSNIERDKKNISKLHKEGWKTLVIWECALKGKQKQDFNILIRVVSNWIQFDTESAEIPPVVL